MKPADIFMPMLVKAMYHEAVSSANEVYNWTVARAMGKLVNSVDFVLFVKKGCPNCEEAEGLLRKYNYDPFVVNVDAEHLRGALQEFSGTGRLPVIFMKQALIGYTDLRSWLTTQDPTAIGARADDEDDEDDAQCCKDGTCAGCAPRVVAGSPLAGDGHLDGVQQILTRLFLAPR